MEREIVRQIGAAAAVTRSQNQSVVVKKELSPKGKALDLPISLLSYPHLQYGHELWVMTERTRSQIDVAETSFLRWVAGHSLYRVRSSVT